MLGSVLRMLERIESTDNVPAFLDGLKNREVKPMGFGHRVYRTTTRVLASSSSTWTRCSR
jgi:citrate synthase